MTTKSIISIAISLLAVCHVEAQTLAQHANNFLNSLSTELKAKTHFELSDSERYNMNYVPISRKGPTFNDFTEKQSGYALELLKASLGKKVIERLLKLWSLIKCLLK